MARILLVRGAFAGAWSWEPDLVAFARKHGRTQIFSVLMGEMFGLLAAGMPGPGHPTTYPLPEGPKALAKLEARATVGQLAVLP